MALTFVYGSFKVTCVTFAIEYLGNDGNR